LVGKGDFDKRRLKERYREKEGVIEKERKTPLHIYCIIFYCLP
jgi:hypothetical protein